MRFGWHVPTAILLLFAGSFCSLSCTGVRPYKTLDAARLADLAQARAVTILDTPGPCRTYFNKLGVSDPGSLMRSRDIRAVHLEPRNGKPTVAGTPKSDTKVLLVNVSEFAGLSLRGATLVLIHELTHAANKRLLLSEDAGESVAQGAELACFGGRGDLWEIESWNGANDG